MTQINGCLEGHRNAMSTVGELWSADVRVTVQREWSVGATIEVKPGATPSWHACAASSTARQIREVSDGEDDTISAETAPGPSLAKMNVRVVRFGSLSASSTTLVKVIAAVGAVWVGIDRGELV